MPEVSRLSRPRPCFAGDGLDVLRRLWVAPFVAVEHGAGQADAVSAIASDAGYSVERIPRPGGHRESGGRAAMIDWAALGSCVAAGGVAVFPAETAHGLACDPENADAVARLYELKGRPPEKPRR